MTQEEFKVISEVVKESKNIPNAKLEETMDKLTSEFETTKNTIIGMSFKPMKDRCIVYGSDGGYFCTLYRR